MLSNDTKNTDKPQPLRDTEGFAPVNSDVIKKSELTVCRSKVLQSFTDKEHNVGYVNPVRSQNDNELTVKFHTDLLSNIIQTRELNNRYQTNKLIKYVGAYYILKSLTPSGVIQDTHQQISELCRYLNCTTPTFYKLIKNCEKLGYLKRTRQTIVLTSYSAFTETFDAVFTRFTKVKYNYKKQKFNHVLESAYLQLKEQERARTFENKMQANKDLQEELSTVINPDKNGKWQKSLEAIQKEAFNKGHKKMYQIFYLNPFTTCNSKTMTKMFGFKSEQSIAYLKAKLIKKNLIRVEKITVSNTIHIPKNLRVKHLFTAWDSKKKQVKWILPDTLHYAPILEF